MREIEAYILDRIRAAGGWVPFDTFMNDALYAPGLGYYSRGGVLGLAPQDGSDFATSPEISPLFGRALARQLAQALRATRTDTIVEFGAGSGALAAQLIESLDREFEHPCRYAIVEVSPALREQQSRRLAAHGDRVRWWSELPERIEGVVVGNEVLDAMPVKLLHWDGSAWFERGVSRGQDAGASPFVWRDMPCSLRPPFERSDWIPGTVTEIHSQARAWVEGVGQRLWRGAVFLVDYGFGDAEYYHPQRLGGTLMCHQRHRADADPLTEVGQKDITAHVNFTSMALAGQDAGLQVLGYTSQANFLMNCGIVSDLEAASRPERIMAQYLLHEHEMGELFKVLAFADSAHSFEAMGFERGDRSHRL